MLTVSNLPTVPLDGSHFFASQVVFGVEIDAHVVAPFPAKFVDKFLPDLCTVLIRKIGVVDLHMNA